MTTAHDNAGDAKPSPDEAFGRTVHMVMFDKRVKQTQLAEATGIEQSLLSKKLRGLRPWTLAEMISVADALHVDARDLLGVMWNDPSSPSGRRRDDEQDRESTVSTLAPYLSLIDGEGETSAPVTGHLYALTA